MLLAVWLIIAALAELALRIIDFRVLRDASSERSVSYRHDDELGWAPVPDSITTVTAERPIQVRHNSLGLRDRELGAPAKPRIMFVGDSFVWGNDVEAEERFTELLRPAWPDTTWSTPACPATAPIRRCCCCNGSGARSSPPWSC